MDFDWSQLGVAGGALFLLYVFMNWMFKSNNKTLDRVTETQNKSLERMAEMQAKSINDLCQKIDKLTDSNSEITRTLATTVTKITEDNQTNIDYLKRILDTVTRTATNIEMQKMQHDMMLRQIPANNAGNDGSNDDTN